MALSTNKLDEIVEGFIRKLADEIPVEEVILFGSYVRGSAKEYSDIDLAIISDWFRGRSYIVSERKPIKSNITESYSHITPRRLSI